MQFKRCALLLAPLCSLAFRLSPGENHKILISDPGQHQNHLFSIWHLHIRLFLKGLAVGSSTYFVPWALNSCHPIHLTLTFSPHTHSLLYYPVQWNLPWSANAWWPRGLAIPCSHSAGSIGGEELLFVASRQDKDWFKTDGERCASLAKSMGSSFQANGTWESEQRGRAFLQGAVSNNIWGWVSSTCHGYIFHDCDDQDGNLVHSDTCVRMSCKRTTKSCK